MNAETIIHLRTAIQEACWPCVLVWCGPPLVLVSIFAWVLA
jgi:hypothetical protein